MLSLIAESLNFKFLISVALAAACAYLYYKIHKRRKALEAASSTPEAMLEAIKVKHFKDDNDGFKKFIAACTRKDGVCPPPEEEKKVEEPVTAEIVEVVLEEKKTEEKKPEPALKKEGEKKRRTRKKKVMATKIELD